MKCPRCGNEFTTRFCTKCGYCAEDTKVEGNNQENSQINNQIPENVSVSYGNADAPAVNNTKNNTKKGLIIGLAIGGALILLVIIGLITYALFLKSDKSAVDKGNNIFSSSSSQSIGPPLGDEEIQQMYKKPQDLMGRTVTLTGKVYANPKYSADNLEFKIFSDIKNFTNSTVILSNDVNIEVKKGDFVCVTGVLKDAIMYSTETGATFVEPQIEAVTIECGTYDEIIDPTIKEGTVQTPWQAQYGYIIEVKKVELAKDETRVYVSIQNNGIDNFKVYPTSVKLLQGSTQYSYTPNYTANYPSIETDLLPDAHTEGVITFPAVQQGEFNIIFTTFIGDSTQLKPYDFIVTTK